MGLSGLLPPHPHPRLPPAPLLTTPTPQALRVFDKGWEGSYPHNVDCKKRCCRPVELKKSSCLLLSCNSHVACHRASRGPYHHVEFKGQAPTPTLSPYSKGWVRGFTLFKPRPRPRASPIILCNTKHLDSPWLRL